MYYTSKNVYTYISTLKKDPIVEWKTCKISGSEFPIYASDKVFYDKISPVIGGVTYSIPSPTLCPEERQRRRLMFRNESNLYKRKCSATGEHIISIYSPDKPYKVYNQEYRWSKKWDPMDYGQTIDFSKTFTDQFGALLFRVPKYALSVVKKTMENSDYTNQGTSLKNCYFLFNSNGSTQCCYGKGIENSTTCFDCLKVYNCSSCFEAIFCHNCDSCFYVQDLNNSSFCWYSKKLQNCTYCFGCNGLVDKKYCIFNKQYTKGDYLKKIKNLITTTSCESLYELVNNLCLDSVSCEHIGSQGLVGNYLSDSKNALFCFDGERLSTAKYCTDIKDAPQSNTNIFDISYFGHHISSSYECTSVGNDSSNVFFSHQIRSSHDIRYCDSCHGCSYCFGCVGLCNASYCIFNVQYSKDDYYTLVAKLILHMQFTGEWGEFFSSSLSLFGYNETLAQNYFPLSRQDAWIKKYSWQDITYDVVIPEGIHGLQGDEIPIDSVNLTDDILKKIFVCEISGRPFTIIKQELDFYRTYALPLPRKHPDVRHQERMKKRLPRELYIRKCSKCKNEKLSVYNQQYVGNIFCNQCYNKFVLSCK